MSRIPCPYLHGEVELTGEREQHIAEHHPELLPAHKQRIIDTLTDPDQVRLSKRIEPARLFSRWFDDLRGGKHVVVVVMSDSDTRQDYSRKPRAWIITAYITGKLAPGEIEWKKN